MKPTTTLHFPHLPSMFLGSHFFACWSSAVLQGGLIGPLASVLHASGKVLSAFI